MKNNNLHFTQNLLDISKNDDICLLKNKIAAKVHTLLCDGADPNRPDRYGYTPLIYAAYFGNIELTRVLLKHGGDPTFKNKFGRSALDYAINFANHPILDLIKYYCGELSFTFISLPREMIIGN